MRPLFRAASKRRSTQTEEMSLRTQCHQVKPKCLAMQSVFDGLYENSLAEHEFKNFINIITTEENIRLYHIFASTIFAIAVQRFCLPRVSPWRKFRRGLVTAPSEQPPIFTRTWTRIPKSILPMQLLAFWSKKRHSERLNSECPF